MTNTVVGYFNDATSAERARSELAALDIPSSDIQVYDRSSSGVATESDTSEKGYWESFKEALGFGSSDEAYYQEGLRRGGTLVSVRADDSRIDRIAEIMGRNGAVDIDKQALQWRESGWAGASHPSAGTGEAGVAIPVVEEKLKVGKRDVKRGGVRVYKYVSETPVEETVRLRDETVRVERQPADRPVTADVDLFKEETIELAEVDEEPVVSKQARVVEEVTIFKDVEERAATITDTIRRTDVNVEHVSGERSTFPTDDDFRRHWSTSYGGSGLTYAQYGPAYRYGAQLSYGRHGDWASVEPEARRTWEEKNPGTWDKVKDAIRYAWDRGRQKLSPQRKAA